MSGESNIPDWVTTDELATLIKSDVDFTRLQIRKNKDVLKPFKLGRETRMERENVEIYINLLQQNKI